MVVLATGHQGSPHTLELMIHTCTEQTWVEAGGKLASTKITCVHTCAVTERRWSASNICSTRNGTDTNFPHPLRNHAPQSHPCPHKHMTSLLKVLLHSIAYVLTYPQYWSSNIKIHTSPPNNCLRRALTFRSSYGASSVTSSDKLVCRIHGFQLPPIICLSIWSDSHWT